MLKSFFAEPAALPRRTEQQLASDITPSIAL